MEWVVPVDAALRPGVTKLVWVETPAIPLWTITDLAATAELVHAAGAPPNARTRDPCQPAQPATTCGINPKRCQHHLTSRPIRSTFPSKNFAIALGNSKAIPSSCTATWDSAVTPPPESSASSVTPSPISMAGTSF